MKVIIQIPAYNEEHALPVTLSQLPTSLRGVDKVEVLVIDDGSTDDTVAAAIDAGVNYVIAHNRNFGLAQAFLSGLAAASYLGADIIVNTDADNQYCADDIQTLIDPILQGRAEYVIGTRPIKEIAHWSFIKKVLQYIGSWSVRKISQVDVDDAPSGFRAITRDAAVRLHVFNRYTYTLETIIQARYLDIRVASVPIRTNAEIRKSRLIHNMWQYVQRSAGIILRSFIIYSPLKFFLTISTGLFVLAFAIGIRYLFFYFTGSGSGHVQSLILGVGFFVFATSLLTAGIIADLVAVNRNLLEHIDYRLQKVEEWVYRSTEEPPEYFNRARLIYRKNPHSKMGKSQNKKEGSEE